MSGATHLNSGSGAASSTMNVSVTPTTGRRLVVCIMIDSPFDAPTVSSVTWNGNALAAAVALDGNAGSPYDWQGAAIYHYQVASGATANVAVTLSGSATRWYVEVLELDGTDTGGSPIGDTDSSQNSANDQTLTLTTAVNDVVVFCITSDQTAADRWYEAFGSTVQDYNSDPKPASSGPTKAAAGHIVAAGTSTQIGFTGNFGAPASIPTAWEALYVAAVFKVAAGGGGGSSSFLLLTADDEY